MTHSARWLMGAGGTLALALLVAAGAQQAGRAAGRGGPGGAAGAFFSQPAPRDWNDNSGFVALFNGKNLDGWKGDPAVWHVVDGAITAQTTPEHPTGTTNIWYTRAQPANFILKEEVRMVGNGNGGIQFRSTNKPGLMPTFDVSKLPAAQQKMVREMMALQEKNKAWSLVGYQEDMDTAGQFSGQLYEQGNGRGIIAFPGQVVLCERGKKPRLLATIATPAQIKSWIPDLQGWNQYEIIADGSTVTQMVNGHVTSIVVDNDPGKSASRGVIGMEIEGQNVTISYRDVQLKTLP